MHIKHLSTQELAGWLNDDTERDVNIIDIRDPQSYANGHIDGAVHIDNSNVAAYIERADQSVPLVVCCYHGNSSQGAAQYFTEQGFKNAYSLDGGYEAWKLL